MGIINGRGREDSQSEGLFWADLFLHSVSLFDYEEINQDSRILGLDEWSRRI